MLFTTLRWLRSAGYSPAGIASAIIPSARFAILRVRHHNVKGGPVSIRRGADIRIGPHANVHLGRYVRILGDFSGRIEGRLRIGDDVFINRGGYLAVKDSVTIGDHCMFGEYVSIHDENHGLAGTTLPLRERGYVTAPVSIGNNVWVGAKATILAGITIGDNSVIGANAVVTHDIPANCVAVGVPARVIHALNAQPSVHHTTEAQPGRCKSVLA